MIVSISQPTLFPWIGYFDMIKNSDVFVFLDNVEFKKQTWQMRNRLKIRSKIEDSEIWVRIPTKSTSSHTLIKDIHIDNSQDWKQKHLDVFQSNYGKESKQIPFLEELYQQDWDKISDFSMAFITECCHFLEIPAKFILASELQAEGRKSHLVLDICKRTNASELLANSGSRDYLEKDKDIFTSENIKLSYHNYVHKSYDQKGIKFMENLSILDLLFSELKNSKNFV